MLTFRNTLCRDDPEAIRRIASSTGFFDKNDIEINFGMAVRALSRSNSFDDDYQFMLLENNGKVIGYACFGKIPTTEANYEIYWLSVDNSCRGRGWGRLLLNKVVETIGFCGGRKIFIKTEGSRQYLPTRRFYYSCGFEEEAVLKEYYADNDDCCIFSLCLPGMSAANRMPAE
ncbi:MAG: GNAT family N-acetyltransferase [Proteobacteria bacterium]|nr:GNAT family N-acetyltransferase [Pseudomonadota bacterium]